MLEAHQPVATSSVDSPSCLPGHRTAIMMMMLDCPACLDLLAVTSGTSMQMHVREHDNGSSI